MVSISSVVIVVGRVLQVLHDQCQLVQLSLNVAEVSQDGVENGAGVVLG